MIMKQKKFKHMISISFLLILTISSVLLVLPLIPSNSVNNINDEEANDKGGFRLPVLSNGVGEDPWWNVSYQWRQCINITNPGGYNLTDNIIKIQFNWKNLFDSGHLQENLNDIRIVENGVIRNYYIKKDFPSVDLASVWFETNSTTESTEYDTYLYYGNNTVGRAKSYYMDHCPDGIARWDFEEGSGNMAYDSMNNYDGTFVNMDSNNFISTPEIQGDYALTFDGVNEFIALNMSYNSPDPDYQATTLTGPIYQFTATAWVKINEHLGGWSILDFDRSEYFTFAAGEPGYRASDGHVEFDTSYNGGTNDFTGSTNIDEDVPAAWYHCVVTFDYSLEFDKKVYVDGVLDAQVNAWNLIPVGDVAQTRFGFIGDGSEATTFNGGRNSHYFQGALDDVRYFDYALTDKEIEWLANYYPLDIDLLGEVERAATVTITVKDVDDRLVPGAEVALWNGTQILNISGITSIITDSNGEVVFSRVLFGKYNITVNYTLISELYENVVYDSRDEIDAELEFKGLVVDTTVYADLWTIDFEVDDWDGDPFNYGYINVSAGASEVLEKLILDSNGEATFRWVNRSSYNYTVFYDNEDYIVQNPTPLNFSTINRAGPMIYYEYIKTSMSKLDILVIDNTGTETVTGVTIKVEDTMGTDIIELETDTTGYAYGDLTKDFGFWYKTGQTYNFTLWIVSMPQTFIVNTSDQPKPPSITPWYNYSLEHKSTLVFQLDLNFTQRIANFTSDGWDPSVNWGEDMSFWVLYESSNNSGQDWEGDWNRQGFPTSATWAVYTKLGQKILEQPMVQASGPTGNFTITINSNFLSAGDGSEFYFALVSGYKPFWNNPDDVYFGFSVYAKSTGLTLHNYTSMPNELPKNLGLDYEISEYYGNFINISARFFDDVTNTALTPDTFTYDWDYGTGSLEPGPIVEYYTFGIDTSLATNVGKYRFDITASYENYSKIESFVYVNIISRPTTINGSSGLFYLSEDIFIFVAKNFTFDYIDVFSANPISNLDEKSFLLQKLENGVPIPGTTETGELVETVGNKFVLDLDTITRDDGEYSIIVTLNKLNYEHRIAIISLTIKKKIFHIQLSDEFKGKSKIGIDSGASLRFTLALTDPNNGSVPVIGANLSITFKGKSYAFVDNGDGNYSINIPKIADAFFLPATFTATITINREDFSSASIPITIVVNMHETFGFPTFYLLMIVGAIVAVTASLAIYRTVQQARIPTFVKKARKMKKDIKSKKTISESLLYPSKEEYLVKQLGDRWDMLGLSLSKVLGIESKKKKTLPETPGEFKDLKGGVE